MDEVGEGVGSVEMCNRSEQIENENCKIAKLEQRLLSSFRSVVDRLLEVR